jgi:hypothetical protein
MFRFIPAFFLTFLLSAALFAQAAPGSPRAASGLPAVPAGAAAQGPDLPAQPFSFIPLLETLSAGEILWQPDWPPEMPPDLFTVTGNAVSDRPQAITVTLEFPAGADRTDAGEKAEYVLAYDGAGRLTDFPFFVNGGFFQTQVSYEDEAGPEVRGSPARITDLAILAPRRWQIEFLEYDDETGLPALARLNAGSAAGTVGDNAAANTDSGDNADSGSAWFFVVLEYRGTAVSETWYDAAGTGLAVYQYRYALQDGKKRLSGFTDLQAGDSRGEEYHYDSWGNLTGIKGEGSVYSAVYRGRQPRYWRRPLPVSPPAETAAIQAAPAAVQVGPSVAGTETAPASETAPSGEIPWRFIIQWDERGLITRLLGYPEDENAGGEWDTRYDYTPDNNGNWKERRETRMIRLGDYLLPRAGVFIQRRIEYQEYMDGRFN